MNILDFIFPKTCASCGRVGNYLCENCSAKIESVGTQICPICTKPSISGLTHPRCKSKLSLDGIYSFVYFTLPIPQTLYKLIYKFVQTLAEELIDNMRITFPAYLKNHTLTVVPLHSKRENWRGFNQTDILARLVAHKFKLRQEKDVLRRRKYTKNQVGLSRKNRGENVRYAFEVVDKKIAKGKNYLIFDDVWTSGATLRNAGNALKRAEAASVWGLTLARSR